MSSSSWIMSSSVSISSARSAESFAGFWHLTALDSTQRALPEIDHRDRLIADDGDDAVEQHRLLLRLARAARRRRNRLLSGNRSGDE